MDYQLENVDLESAWKVMKFEENGEARFLELLRNKMMLLNVSDKTDELETLLNVWDASKVHEFNDVAAFLIIIEKAKDNLEQKKTYLRQKEKREKEEQRLRERQEIGQKEEQRLRERQEIGRLYCDSILNDLDPLDENTDMKVMNGVVNLETSTLDNIQRIDVVIRSNTQPFWASCLEKVDSGESRRRVCAIGTPGIGKTTLTAYLIRMLLNRTGVTKVVYHLPQQEKGTGFCYEFIVGPDNRNSRIVNVYRESNDPESILSLKDKNTYYIVDPGQTKDSCNPLLSFQAKVIIVSSPNPDHWGGPSFSKYRGWNTVGLLFFMPVWNRDEIIHASPKLFKHEFPIDELHGRFDRVGGVVRHLFAADDVYQNALSEQDRARQSLTFEQTWSIVKGDFDALGNLDKNMPRSAVAVYNSPNNDFLCGKVCAVSSLLLVEIFKKFKEQIYEKLENQFADNGEVYEEYVMADLATGMHCSVRPGVGLRDKNGRQELSNISFEPVATFKKTSNCLLKMAKQEPMVLFLSTSPTHPLFDFCHQDDKGSYHLFQVTTGETHDCRISQIESLDKRRDQIGIRGILNLYYVVHKRNFNNFVTVPVDPMSKTTTCNIKIWHLLSLDPKKQT